MEGFTWVRSPSLNYLRDEFVHVGYHMSVCWHFRWHYKWQWIGPITQINGSYIDKFHLQLMYIFLLFLQWRSKCHNVCMQRMLSHHLTPFWILSPPLRKLVQPEHVWDWPRILFQHAPLRTCLECSRHPRVQILCINIWYFIENVLHKHHLLK